jgi:hypothetical protein
VGWACRSERRSGQTATYVSLNRPLTVNTNCHYKYNIRYHDCEFNTGGLAGGGGGCWVWYAIRSPLNRPCIRHAICCDGITNLGAALTARFAANCMMGHDKTIPGKDQDAIRYCAVLSHWAVGLALNQAANTRTPCVATFAWRGGANAGQGPNYRPSKALASRWRLALIATRRYVPKAKKNNKLAPWAMGPKTFPSNNISQR